ncbi:MAG: GlmU family protein [Bacteroidota bacterium]
MNIVLFDDPLIRTSLLPLTFTRPVAEIRVGILKIAEKWAQHFEQVSYKTEDFLSKKYPRKSTSDSVYVNGAVCPSEDTIKSIKTIQKGESLWQGETLIASHDLSSLHQTNRKQINYDLVIIDKIWKIFKLNGAEIRSDFAQITEGRESCPINDPNTVIYNPENVFIEPGATIKAAIINAENGPIYIGKNVNIQEGAIIHGTHAFCEGAVANMGAKMRGDSTVGPYSKVGGEVSNSVIFGYSNKGHDGFLGNSILGEWCNLGADTNTSNLKNDYGDVKIWDYKKPGFAPTGEMFCGLIMGDHSKAGINTMFNTGTVVGVSSNIFGSGFPRNFIPSFAWGGAAGFSTYQLKKVFDVAPKVMERRNVIFDDIEKEILEAVFKLTAKNRIWES